MKNESDNPVAYFSPAFKPGRRRISVRSVWGFWMGFLLCPLAIRGASAEVDVSKLPPPATIKIDFVRDIKPILDTSCLRCHNAEKAKSGFRLDNRNGALKGGENGVDIFPGNSAKSPLIHYSARLVEDMEMPPDGKGIPLTSAQVGVLRAWIDQGVVWDSVVTNQNIEFTVSPIFGATGVSGDAAKFREHYWMPEGGNGGVEKFEIFQRPDPDTRVLFTGHALLHDYKLDWRADRTDVGFVHAGWEQYRKYYDNNGGYYPPFMPPSYPQNQDDLHLDIGKVWIDLGLNLPQWPRMVLGYEYDYRKGEEATTDWGSVLQPPRSPTRNIVAEKTDIHEGTHVIKFELDEETKVVTIEERFRGEFYKLDTLGTNFSPGRLSGGNPAPNGYYSESVREGSRYFQGANTIRLEKQITDWLLGSAGYLYSKLNADSTFDRGVLPQPGNPLTATQLLIPQITLERESHVVNANALFSLFKGMTLTAGAQGERTRQSGFGSGSLNSTAPASLFDPSVLGSHYDLASVEETLALRYSGIPYTALFADARLQQQTLGQSGDYMLDTSSGLGNSDDISFSQQTHLNERLVDFRTGFNTSPWQIVSLSADYTRSEDDSRYNNGQLEQPVGVPNSGYPGFITARNLLTQQVRSKLVLHTSARLKSTLGYEYRTTHTRTDTSALFGTLGGGELITGKQVSQTFLFGTSFQATRKLFLSATFDYQPSTLITASINSTAIVPYRGDIYSLIFESTYLLNSTTDLSASYAYSSADYGQNNLATGLPLGIQYEQHSLQSRLTRRLGKNLSARLEYRFNYYAEPSSGGIADYTAHAIFANLTYKF